MFASGDGKVRVECRFESDTLWLSQAMICELYGKAKATISEHIKHIFEEGELEENSVVRFYRTTASDGKNYQVQHFSLPLILAVGYRVRSSRHSVPPVGNPDAPGIPDQRFCDGR
jgi:hypothetical protein